MPASTLDVDESTPPVTHKGHGTDALGPSDSSDSGSDLQGPGLYEIDADVSGLDRGTNEDMPHAGGAGRDVGDATSIAIPMPAAPVNEPPQAVTLKMKGGSDIAPDRLLGSGVPIPADALDRIAIEEEDDLDSEDDDLKE